MALSCRVDSRSFTAPHAPGKRPGGKAARSQTAGSFADEPKSMLHVSESHVERAKFPLIDIHTHISAWTRSEAGVELAAERQYLGTPQDLLAVMERKNIRAMVNLTGGYEKGLAETVVRYDRAYPGGFAPLP